ncbi:unnamed protein product, partial [Mesorhabditis belari]|uniref:Uncharacterized protein n=1 Tax=Mesorhabditis belari TaxID=2138241 RepID=A0AAF3ER19_9BILA
MNVETLKYCTMRRVAMLLVEKQLRWRRLTEVALTLKDIIRALKLPLKIRKVLQEAVSMLLREVQRWADKHVEMFPFQAVKKGRTPRSEHVRTFQPWIVWKQNRLEIDDLQTAKSIMENECKSWAQMRWQFACCYAMEDEILDDWKYDRHRRTTFKKTLSNHPVYDFWSTLYETRWEAMFETERRLPNQIMTQCFIFALTNGYFELVKFLWNKIGPGHREYVGLLQWKAFCFRCRDRDTMRFVCGKLCEVNARSIARITWCTFFDAFYKAVNNEETDKVIEQKNRCKVEFLLANCCDVLRRRLLGMENFRVISDAFRYNLEDLFTLFLEHLDKEDLRAAREVVDRIQDRTKSCHGGGMQRMILRKQMTFS